MNARKLQKYLDRPNPAIENHNLPENRYVSVAITDSKGRYLRRRAALPVEHNIVWVDQRNEPGRTTTEGLEWVRNNVENCQKKYTSFTLFVWLGTCNFCNKNKDKYLSLKENVARVAAQVISDLRQIVEIGFQNNFQVVLLEIPVYCIQEYNRVHGHKSPSDFQAQDEILHQNIQKVNEEIRKINLNSGKVSPMFNLDLRRKRPGSPRSNRCYYNFAQYEDGLHPNVILSKYWLRKIAELVRSECY